jgi:hypothetical protein
MIGRCMSLNALHKLDWRRPGDRFLALTLRVAEWPTLDLYYGVTEDRSSKTQSRNETSGLIEDQECPLSWVLMRPLSTSAAPR